MLYLAAPVEAFQVTRPFAEVIRLVPGSVALKEQRRTIGVIVAPHEHVSAHGAGRVAYEGWWIVIGHDGARQVMSDEQFRALYRPVPQMAAAA